MSVERTSIEDSLHVDIELKESGDDWLCGAQIATHLLTGATFVEITLARHLQFDKQTQSFNEEFISAPQAFAPLRHHEPKSAQNIAHSPDYLLKTPLYAPPPSALQREAQQQCAQYYP